MPFRVLVVDDVAAFRDLARRLLAGAGMQVVGAVGTGAEAVAAARADRPDVVLLDVQLADADGFAVCRALRAEGFEVVLCSVRDEGDFAGEVAACGARGFLPKHRLSATALLRVFEGGRGNETGRADESES
jgi:DNA-binding NarL/FixJ family response regulator